MSEKNVPDEVVHHLLQVFNRFHRIFLDENRRQEHTAANSEKMWDIKHSERMLMFNIMDMRQQFPEGVSVSDLSRRMHVKPPSITAPLNSLEECGLVSRVQDANDRRIVRVHITENGYAFMERSRQILYARTRSLVEFLGVEKAEQLTDIMEDIFTYFQMTKHNHTGGQS